MKICVIGEHSGVLDEGMRTLSFHLVKQLSKDHQTLALDIRDFHRRRFWKDLAQFQPDIVHNIHGPTIASLIMVKMHLAIILHGCSLT